jgi:C4-type Zn-finger protein
MRWLINYLRECFCKHDFHVDEKKVNQYDGNIIEKSGIKVYLLCKKCGYHKNHWKYLQ